MQGERRFGTHPQNSALAAYLVFLPAMRRNWVARKVWLASMRQGTFAISLALGLAFATTAHAAGPLGEQGTPITTSRY